MSSTGSGQISCRKWVSFYLRPSLILPTLSTLLLFTLAHTPTLRPSDGCMDDWKMIQAPSALTVSVTENSLGAKTGRTTHFRYRDK